MLNKAVPLSPEVHKDLRIKQTGTLEHIQNSHIAAVSAHEFIAASSSYPILFAKDSSREGFRPVIVWGLEAGENLFIKDGKWNGSFVPASARCFPFVSTVQEVDNKKRVYIGIHEDSDLVSKEEGERIFDDEGKETEWFKKNLEFISEVNSKDHVSLAFSDELKRLELIYPLSFSYKNPEGEEKKIGGLYAVEPKKLEELSDEDFLSLRKSNYLAPIYAHLSSLDNINKLLQLRYPKK